MQPRRSFAHGNDGGWSSIAVHLAPAEDHKEGFYLSLFADARAPQVVFLRPQQLASLLDMAATSTVSDQQLWEAVAKIPIEPLLPNRSLATRLRALLVDETAAIRDHIREQLAREPVLPRDPEPETNAIADGLGHDSADQSKPHSILP
jgi:hypothetical protein